MKKISPLVFMLVFCLQGRTQSMNNALDKYQTDSSYAEQQKLLAIQLGIPLIRVAEGQFSEFQYFAPDGTPVYYSVDNRDAGRTISTDKLYNGGGLGLDLSGDSMIIGEWDGGKVRLTHVEFDGRAVQVDGASSNNDHATHVGVTLVGKGVKAAARGMSYKATLNAYDWNLDEPEMAQAAANGLLISNHSYGNITGWFENKSEDRWEWYGDTTISADEDWKYGFYNSQARDWDEIAHDNPYYLIVKSAGNDRNDKLPDGKTHWIWSSSQGKWVESTTARANTGPYDCISGAGNAKNVLTVGAVNAIPTGYTQVSDVVMSTFSSWGPTDDGRIKPDICGNGVGVNSGIASGDDDYATYNGTSMASPNVAGSLLLLQEHYHNLNNVYMRASTLKGLTIHTADEAGDNPGPDYTFGWGLANMAKAAQTISNSNNAHRIIESSIQPNGSFEVVVYNDGNSLLWATLSWTDPEASVSNTSLDPNDKKLINDLDMRIIRLSDNTMTEPWKLDLNNPSNAATRGNNDLDNVEKVELSSPQAGFYKILVQTGTLQNNASQDFSLIISGEAPGLQAGYLVSDSVVCSHNAVPFQADVLGTPDTYEWTFIGPDTLTYSDVNPHALFTKPGVYTVKLKVSNPATADSVIHTDHITVNASPDYSITPLSGLFCDNDTIEYPLSGTAMGQYFGDGVIADKWNPNRAGSGLHWIYGQLTGTNNCTRTDSFDIEVKNAPVKASITLDGSELVSSSAANNQWFIDGQIIPGANNQRFTPTASGTYRVDVTNASGCISQSDNLEHWMSGIAPGRTETHIYPNPASDQVQINWGTKQIRIVAVYDSKGSLLAKMECLDAFLEIQTSTWVEGMIFIHVTSSDSVTRHKVMIQH